MSFSFGFYNSINHDRKYNAIQMSEIFDGIILDGIFMSIGERFEVTASGEDMFILVGSGRAWFNHTWNLNDAPLPIEVPQSELLLNRYDAVVIEVNVEQSVRANEIKIVTGVPSSNPVYPELIHTSTVNQYPLAYIYVARNTSNIRQADITSMIGKEPTPYVTSPLEKIDIEDMVKQWEDQWKRFFEEQTEDITITNAMWKEQWETFYKKYTEEMDAEADYWKELWHSWYHMYTDSSAEEFSNWKKAEKEAYEQWLADLKAMATGDPTAEMAVEIADLNKRVNGLELFIQDLSKQDEFSIESSIRDSENDPIIDDKGNDIFGSITFQRKI